MSVLQVNDLHASYSSSGSEILKGISFDVAENDFVAIIGPSGAGKSTLIRCINRLVEPSSGSIIFKGQNITNMSKSELRRVRRDIGMIFQEFNLINRMSVMDNLLSGRLGYIGNIRTLFKAYPRKDIDRAIELLERVGLIDHIDKRADELSGGQRQRVAIGRAITRKPKVFLFDEPLSNLDAALRVQMRVELAKLHDQLNATMIYVTHDQTEAMTLADDIVVLDHGIVSQKGSPLKLYNEPENLFVGGFIGSPKMNFINSKVISSNSSGTEVEISGQGKIIVPKTSDKVSPGDSVKIGIRPEHILINTGEKCWNSKVFVIEKLGSSTFLYLEKDGEPLVVQTDGENSANIGDNLSLSFDLNKCHLFDENNLAFK